MSVEIGSKFNKWTVIGVLENLGQGRRKVMCLCECGTEKHVDVGNLTKGLSKNCGCIRKINLPASTRKHGAGSNKYKGSKASSSYMNMLGRCRNKNHRDYHNWGGRGITICDRWLGTDGFENFLADMGEPTASGLSIERKDNSGPYSPDNCKWGTRVEQMNNTRGNRFITHNGKTMTVAQWGETSGIGRRCFEGRVRRGLTGDKLFAPPKRRFNLITIKGVTKPESQWAEIAGVATGQIQRRLEAGFTEDELLVPYRALRHEKEAA